jgi:hypothetical protein
MGRASPPFLLGSESAGAAPPPPPPPPPPAAPPAPLRLTVVIPPEGSGSPALVTPVLTQGVSLGPGHWANANYN